MEPKEFKEMVKKVRDVEISLGQVNYHVSEKDLLRRRSLFICQDIAKGEKLTYENIRSIRPGYGLHPKYYDSIIGKTINQDVKKGTPLSWEIILD